MREVITFYREDVAVFLIREHARNEFCGPCPSCGGRDRFHCSGTRWGCRVCGKQGDTVGYLKTFRGMSVREACQLAEWKKDDSQGFSCRKNQDTADPSVQWATQAEKLVSWSQQNLVLPAGRELLAKRHITLETALAAGIGFIPSSLKMDRETWGLPARQDRDWGFIPSGLLLSTRYQTGVKALQVRCYPPLNGGIRHFRVEGSGRGFSYVIGCEKKAVCLFESILDAILAWQTSEGLLTCIATGSASVDVGPQGRDLIQCCNYIFCCPDRDDAGREAWHRWEKEIPSVKLANPFKAKDLGELAGERPGALKEWFLRKILAPMETTPAALPPERLCQNCTLWQPISFGFRGACAEKGFETSAIARCSQIAYKAEYELGKRRPPAQSMHEGFAGCVG